jgi:hypothetical protein
MNPDLDASAGSNLSPPNQSARHLIAEMARRYKKSYNQSDTAKMIDTAQPNLALAAVVLDYAQDLERRSTFGSDSACWIPILKQPWEGLAYVISEEPRS